MILYETSGRLEKLDRRGIKGFNGFAGRVRHAVVLALGFGSLWTVAEILKIRAHGSTINQIGGRTSATLGHATNESKYVSFNLARYVM